MLGVICVYSQLWLLGTCPPCLIVSSPLPPHVYHVEPCGTLSISCSVLESYKHTGWKSLISKGKRVWGGSWGSEARMGTRVCVSPPREDSAHLEGEQLPWAPESWLQCPAGPSTLYLSPLQYSKGELYHNNQKVSGEDLNPYQRIHNLLDSSNMIYCIDIYICQWKIITQCGSDIRYL